MLKIDVTRLDTARRIRQLCLWGYLGCMGDGRYSRGAPTITTVQDDLRQAQLLGCSEHVIVARQLLKLLHVRRRRDDGET